MVHHTFYKWIVGMLCIFSSHEGRSQVPLQDEILLRVVGFNLTQGFIRMEAFNSSVSFIEQAPLKESESEYINRFSDNYVYVKLEGLPVGNYLIRVYHDIDENGELDVDKEPYTFYSPKVHAMGGLQEDESSVFETFNFLYTGGDLRAIVKLPTP